jgi:hypothetical protein
MVPPEADGPVFFIGSVVPCFTGPGQDPRLQSCQGVVAPAGRPRPVPGNGLKKPGRRVRMAENVLDGPRPRGLIFRALSIERPDSAKDDGDALILVRPDQYET